MSYTGRCAGQDDSSRLQRRSLGAEAHDLGDGENQITIHSISTITPILPDQRRDKAHSTPHSCKTLPFFKPLSLNLLGSGIALVEAITGPIGQAPSKPFE
jgi:hypothetical protein